MWYTLGDVRATSSGEVSASVTVTDDLPWFSGHFPGEPILPGIAQLGMVLDMIKHIHLEVSGISRVSRVRFKQVVQPGDCLQIFVTPVEREPGAYAFRLLVEKELVCTGMMNVE